MQQNTIALPLSGTNLNNLSSWQIASDIQVYTAPQISPPYKYIGIDHYIGLLEITDNHRQSMEHSFWLHFRLAKASHLNLAASY